MKKSITVVLILLLVVGAVVLVKKKMAANSALSSPVSYDLNVKTFTPKEGNVSLGESVLVLIKNDRDATLSAKFPASVLSILPAGTAVRTGDIVARLDDRDLTAKQESLKSALSSAQNEEKAKELALSHEDESHKRTLELLAVKGASIEQSQTEESRIALLKADLAAVKSKQAQIKADTQALNAQLSYTTLRSPVNGVVGEIFAAVGDVAVPGKPIASVRAESGSYGWVRLPLGTPAKALIVQNHRAPLRFLQNSNGLDEYRADFPLSFPSGARVEGKLISFEGQGVFLPRDAVLLKEGKAYIFFVKEHKSVTQEITIIAKGDEGFIIDALPEGKLAMAKSDIFLKLLAGASVATKE